METLNLMGDWALFFGRIIMAGYLIASIPLLIYAIAIIVWHNSIKPRLIPHEEIRRLADEITAKYPDDPDEAAYRELEAAWWRSEGDEEVKWKRVLKEIRRREKTGDR